MTRGVVEALALSALDNQSDHSVVNQLSLMRRVRNFTARMIPRELPYGVRRHLVFRSVLRHCGRSTGEVADQTCHIRQ